MPWLKTGVLKSRPTNCNICPWALLIVKPKHGCRGKYCSWKVNTGKVIYYFIKSVTCAFFPVESLFISTQYFKKIWIDGQACVEKNPFQFCYFCCFLQLKLFIIFFVCVLIEIMFDVIFFFPRQSFFYLTWYSSSCIAFLRAFHTLLLRFIRFCEQMFVNCSPTQNYYLSIALI